MSTKIFRAIFLLADEQMGYVTTAQAASVGVSPMALVMMARRGTIERVSRGVYRLASYPTFPLAHYMEGVLWPSGRKGVLSHETALALYGLSDANPGKMHITLPAGFRVQRQTPDYMVVHFTDLPGDDVTRLEKLPITTPARTIRDCIAAHVGPALIKQAVAEAAATNRIGPEVAAQLLRALDAVGHSTASV
ncbi:MAG: type IV toxin-antitoxin system AbiEi family antitoxin domain-containing protein [Gemmatimonas sp.]